MTSGNFLFVWITACMAGGILMAGYLSVPPGALPLLIGDALLLLAALWLLRRGVGALVALSTFFFLMGFLRACLPDVALLPASLVAWSGGVARSLMESLSHMGLSPTVTALLQAMLLGQRGNVSPEVLELYRQIGAAHILALSGLHLTIIFGLINFFVLWLVNHRWRYLVGTMAIGLMWGYALLTAFPLSLCRASLMMTLLLISQMRQVGSDTWHTLGLTAFLLLLLAPSSLFDVGFQLSFMAVAGILLFYRLLADIGRPRHLPRWLWQTFLVSVAAQMGVMPLLLHYFHRFPLSGILLSPVYILLATSIMYAALLLCLIAPLGLGFLLRLLLEGLVACQHGLMSMMSRLPWDGPTGVSLPWEGVLLCYAALLCLLPPLRALREPEVPLPHLRPAFFFRQWPYVLAALSYALGAYWLATS